MFEIDKQTTKFEWYYSENLLNYKCVFDYNIPFNWTLLKREKSPFFQENIKSMI